MPRVRQPGREAGSTEARKSADRYRFGVAPALLGISRGLMGMIRKIGGRYVVLSETTGRQFGTYDTRAEAERRLRQIEFFKHLRGRAPRGRPASGRGRA